MSDVSHQYRFLNFHNDLDVCSVVLAAGCGLVDVCVFQNGLDIGTVVVLVRGSLVCALDVAGPGLQIYFSIFHAPNRTVE